jgi:hypothetical protein
VVPTVGFIIMVGGLEGVRHILNNSQGKGDMDEYEKHRISFNSPYLNLFLYTSGWFSM